MNYNNNINKLAKNLNSTKINNSQDLLKKSRKIKMVECIKKL